MNAMQVKEKPVTNAVLQPLDHTPIRILEIEIGAPLPHLSAYDEQGQRSYQRARCLLRLHTQPLGLIDLQLPQDGLAPQSYAPLIWSQFQESINQHLTQDGLPTLTTLDVDGISTTARPHCLQERDRFLQGETLPLVSVIIPTRDRPERLEKCLATVLTQSYPHYEVIVVDNAPVTDATRDLVTQLTRNYPHLRYLREDRPGISWARNYGIEEARGEILTFTDDDIITDQHWLTELVRGFGQEEHVACVTGLILPLELEHPAQFWFEQYCGFTRGFKLRIYDMQRYHPKIPLHPYISGRFGTGASMAFTAAFLHSIGGFDTVLGGNGRVQCGEDVSALFEVMIQGKRLVYTHMSLAHHLHRRDYPGLKKQLYNYSIGFTAYLTRSICKHPHLFFDLIPKLFYAAFFVLTDRTPRNRMAIPDYPKELKQLELKGMLYGPFAYFLSRKG